MGDHKTAKVECLTYTTHINEPVSEHVGFGGVHVRLFAHSQSDRDWSLGVHVHVIVLKMITDIEERLNVAITKHRVDACHIEILNHDYLVQLECHIHSLVWKVRVDESITYEIDHCTFILF